MMTTTTTRKTTMNAFKRERIVYARFILILYFCVLFLCVFFFSFFSLVVTCFPNSIAHINAASIFAARRLYLALESVNTEHTYTPSPVYAIYIFDEIYFVMTFQWISSLFSMLYFRWNSGC